MSKKEKAPKEEKAPKDEKAKDAKKDAKPEEKDGKKPAEGKDGKEGEAAEGAEGEVAPKKSKKKLIIIIVAALLLVGGGAAGLIFSGVLGGKPAVGKDGKPVKEVKKEDLLGPDGKPLPLDKDGNPIKPKPIFYNMDDITVNLNSPSPRPHFVNLKITLEISSEAKVEDVKNQSPRIVDSFNTYLREMRREDLQGSAGTYRLKKELATRLDKILGDGVVNDVLIREIIVQ